MTTRGSRTNSKCFEMKRLYFILLGLFVFCSCQSLFIEDRAGQVIRFGASMHNGNLTRTHYSNYVDPDTKKERIEWVDGDDVTVYMYWELQPGSSQASPDPEATHSFDYYVTDPYNLGEHKYIHRGKLSPKGNGKPLTWKGSANENVRFDHYFYSTYPAGYSELSYVDPSNVELIFDLPKNDGEMRYAYMAAAAQSVSTRDDNNYEDAVDLDYYPMVTTLHIFLNNQSSTTDGTISVKISNTNELKPLFGKYTASLDNDNKFVAKDGKTNEENSAINEVSKSFTLYAEESDDFLLFIRPHDYDTGEVTLTINNVTWDLPHLKPCYKYNILVNVDDNNGTLEPDPSDPPTIEDISDAVAQLILAYFSYGKYPSQWGESQVDGNYLWPLFEDLFNDNNDFLNNFYNSDGTLGKLMAKLNTVTANDFLNELTEDELAVIWDLITSMTHLLIRSGSDINRELNPKDFIDNFPNVEVLELLYENKPFEDEDKNGKFDIRISEHPSLTDIIIKSNNPNAALTVTECENLNSITVKGCDIDISNCSNLSSVSCAEDPFPQNVTIDNCALQSFTSKDPYNNWINSNSTVFNLKNMSNLTNVELNGAKEIHISDCGLTSFSAKGPWGYYNENHPEVLELINLPDLTTLDAGNAQVIIIYNCPNLVNISYNGNPTITDKRFDPAPDPAP